MAKKTAEKVRPNPRKGRRLDVAERITARKMADSGASKAAIARTLGRSVATVSNAIQDARSILEANAAEYATLHRKAARVAARKGKAAPMEWALERLKVVETPKGSDAAGPRFSVRIGVMLPGLPSQSATSERNQPANVLVAHTIDDDETA